MPPAIDLEFGGNCRTLPSIEEFHNELKTYVSRIRQIYKKEPILYTTEEFYRQYLIQDSAQYNYRVRSIYMKPGRELPDFKIWQYSSVGRIEGIDVRTDFNAAMEKFWVQTER